MTTNNPGGDMKKIGLISKEAHAKSHAKAIENLGHEVIMLGGSPSSLPPTLDAVVVRAASCSHAATALAQRAKREKGLPMIMQNSLTHIVDELNELFPPSAATAPMGRDELLALLPGVPNDCTGAIKNAIQVGGVFFPRLGQLAPGRVSNILQSVGLATTGAQIDRARYSAALVQTWSARTVDRYYRQLIEAQVSEDGLVNYEFEFFTHTLWWSSEKRLCGIVPVLARNELDLSLLTNLATLMKLSVEQPEGYKIMSGANHESPVDLTPIRGDHHSAYYHRTQRKWQLRRKEDGQYTHVGSAEDRDAALIQVMELDEKVEGLPPEKAVEAKPVAVEQPVVEPPVAVEPPKPVVVTKKGKADGLIIVKPKKRKEREEEVKPAPVEVKVIDPKPAELSVEELVILLKSALEKEDKSFLTYQGVKVQLLRTHLLGPNGPACDRAQADEIREKDISKVTCPNCQKTQFYQFAQFALNNLTAGN